MMTRTDTAAVRSIAIGARSVHRHAVLLFGLILISALALLAVGSPIL
jgi:uncharacterized membrane protein